MVVNDMIIKLKIIITDQGHDFFFILKTEN